jgi:hypothetical protein
MNDELEKDLEGSVGGLTEAIPRRLSGVTEENYGKVNEGSQCLV